MKGLTPCACRSFFFISECQCAIAGSQGGRGYLGERIRTWEGQRGLSFLQNMELRGGDLLVPRAGLYYIYAQTYFRLPSTEETEGEAKEEEAPITFHVHRNSEYDICSIRCQLDLNQNKPH